MIPDMWHSGKMPNGRAESRSPVPRLSVRGRGTTKGSMRKFGEMIQLFGYDTAEVNIYGSAL